jgi:hypothetical protein
MHNQQYSACQTAVDFHQEKKTMSMTYIQAGKDEMQCQQQS